jgi:glycosyltransferase involved in cell wall biosynthesis
VPTGRPATSRDRVGRAGVGTAGGRHQLRGRGRRRVRTSPHAGAVQIGLIAPPWVAIPPNGYGGIEAVLDVLARGLREADHDVILFAPGDSTCPVPTVSLLDRAPGVGVGGTAVEVAHVLHAYERVGACDIVHDHTVVGPVYARQFAAMPVVTTNHGPFAPPLAEVYREVARRLPIVAISHHQAATAAGIPIAAVIHHGLDPEAFPVGAGNGEYALFLGRMSPDKGVETAVRAARAAGVRLLVAAKMKEPAEHDYFAATIKPLLGLDIEYIGEATGEEKLALLGGASCLLNPIAWPEPFGMVMIESLACGTPVLATPLGSAPEIVEDGITGRLCADVESLANALQATGDLPREACRLAMTQRFSAGRMVAAHLQLYERLVQRGDAPTTLRPATSATPTPMANAQLARCSA